MIFEALDFDNEKGIMTKLQLPYYPSYKTRIQAHLDPRFQ